MVNRIIIFFGMLLVTSSGFAEKPKPLIGWHWYNEPIKKPIKKREDDALLKSFNQFPPWQQLKILQMATNNLRAKAILSGKVSDIAAYKEAQDFWVSRATQFTVGWEKMLLMHPELNYGLQFSHENALASVMQRDKHARENEAVSRLAKTNGLLFFYRGKHKEDRFFSKIVSHYVKRYHFIVIPISVDGVLSPEFKSSRQDRGSQKARILGINHFPALVLVNPTTHRHQIVSYGFKSEEALSDRLLKISDGWKAEF